MKLEVGCIYKISKHMPNALAKNPLSTYFKVIKKEEDANAGIFYSIQVYGSKRPLSLPAKWFDDYHIRISSKSEVLMAALDE